MQVAMTERDKKLIVMLSIIVIVVAIGYWGILPAVKAMNEAKDEILLEEEITQLNDMKLAQIPVLEMYMTENDAEIDKLKDYYYPMMNSDEIDKMITGLVLERNMFAYDLTISIGETPVDMQPYQYSRMATDPFYESDYNVDSGVMDMDSFGLGDSDSDSSDSEGSGDSSATVIFDDTDTNYNTSIYAADLSLRLGGSKEELWKLIDELAASDKKLLLRNYSWTETSSVEDGDTVDLTGEDIERVQTELTADGEVTIVNRIILNLDLTLYMYQE